MSQSVILAQRRRLQRLFPNGAPPHICVAIANRWDDAIAKDPNGSQLIHLVDEFEEYLTNHKRG